ncbi:hypothetical protein [Nocardioides sp. zg-1228]|uniref:hypothetical protein n=1 Tax=Nocardioides sp. zg-1228 TaxID=2763008 RepID=UPI0016432949|nr:hypothetical protein [Nocardioides sp. zg-1228]MBC2931984.1 hypothetical protein [Nocardioides sp. zg-1228]QSF57540.1 hypothetical protein JX575_18740 [Nocardioides sp. zg-1228]
MTIELDPAAVRAGWHYGDNARAEVQDGLDHTGEAAGHALGDLADALADAAGDMEGVLRVVRGVIDEHRTGTEQCIADFEATDGSSAGEFHGLAR